MIAMVAILLVFAATVVGVELRNQATRERFICLVKEDWKRFFRGEA